MNTDFEILAPAGSLEILKAVINAGADAVYIGGDRFGARAYAQNFNQAEVLEALNYAHLRGKKIYLTVNTLFKNQEIEELYDYLLPYYEHGLDAVIVQDLGAIYAIHSWFPDMEIHTSTQLTVTEALGAELMKKFRVTRIVMARETSLAEMQKIHEATGLEIEAFIHGALCYSYSGQCLFSSLLGGRSGNRGRCAQPCRLPYSVLDEYGKNIKKESYILSLKDFCSIKHLPEFKKAGVYSLKIEGRMKQVGYAASVVAMYRKYVDMLGAAPEAYKVLEEDMKALADYGNRLGFTDAYLHKHNCKQMITYDKPSFTSTAQYVEHSNCYEPIQGELILEAGHNAKLTLQHSKLKEAIEVYGNEVMIAQSRPLEIDDVKTRMQKTKDTAFMFDKLEVKLADAVFFPNGALNQLRRDGITQLEMAILQNYRRDNAKYTMPSLEIKSSTQDKFVISLENRKHLSRILTYDFYDEIWLSVDAYSRAELLERLREDFSAIRKKGKTCGIILPYIFRNETASFYKQIAMDLAALNPDKMIVKNLEEVGYCLKFLSEIQIVADHSIYAFNDWALAALQQLGVNADTIPLELNKSEISRRKKGNTTQLVYGYYPLMTTANCVCNDTVGCQKKTIALFLEDRYKKIFPIRNYCNECYNVIYNSLPTMLLPQLEDLKRSNIHSFRAHFSVENERELERVLAAMETYVQGEKLTEWPTDLPYTNGHYKRGVE